jgi:heptosyltransferase III
VRRLIIRPGGIGDCILSLPAIEHLRSEYTEVWAPSAVVPLIRFAKACALSSTGIDWLGLPGVDPPPGLIARLREFDSIVSWYGSNREEFRERMRELGLPFQFLAALPDPEAKIHAADFFLKQAGGNGFAVPKIGCESVTRDDFAVIHPFSGSARKNWPLQRFREVASPLSMPVRWCAGVLACQRAGVYRQRFRDHASGCSRWNTRGRDFWRDRSVGVGAARRAGASGERDRGG